jgi:hypothetical protein
MRKTTVLLLAALIASVVPGLSAQDKSVNVGWVYATTPKPGMIKQLEEGRKRHMDFHRKQNDSWTWEIWQVETGDSTGSYVSASFGHSWQDLDAWEQKMGTADLADGAVNLAPYAASTTASIWTVLKDSSRPPTTSDHPKLAEVNHFLLKPGTELDFMDASRKITDAINKTNWAAYYTWYALQDGGEGPHYVLLIYMNGWADLAGPEPEFHAMLEKAMGQHDAEALMHSVNQTIKREWTETVRYRPDLSYVPGTK